MRICFPLVFFINGKRPTGEASPNSELETSHKTSAWSKGSLMLEFFKHSLDFLPLNIEMKIF